MLQPAQGVRASVDTQNPDSPETLITAQQLAKRLSISVRSVWRRDAAGELPAPVRIGGAVRWRSEEVNQWIKAGCPSREVWERMNKGLVGGGRQ